MAVMVTVIDVSLQGPDVDVSFLFFSWHLSPQDVGCTNALPML